MTFQAAGQSGSGDPMQDDTATADQRRRTEGHLISCEGTTAVILAHVDESIAWMENYWRVGQLVSISQDNSRIVGQTFRIEDGDADWLPGRRNTIRVHVELLGEISDPPGGTPSFSTGIASYPRIGSVAHRIRAGDLASMYKNSAHNSISVGHLTQEPSIPAKIDCDKLLSRHFAVIGSTGVGKSTSVTLILRKIIERRSDLRVLILDPHNEFTAAFRDKAVVRDASNLSLPFWLFRFDEYAAVVFRGQKGLDEELELLRDLVAEAKEKYEVDEAAAGASIRRAPSQRKGYTADSMVPYRMSDLVRLVDERLGLLDNKRDKPFLKSLKDRLQSISRDPRFDFMFNAANTGGDRMALILADLFRVPLNDRPISIIEMSGLPSEVLSSVVAVLARLAFDLAVSSQGAVQTLVVCEEAHRYVPADSESSFFPTRQAIARIAKEGRKYGAYLAIISQRPSELDQTIFSQCNTVFAMRLANRADQQIIGGALTNGAQSTIGFLASIANRECIAFGEGLKTPMRMTFESIPKELLPGSHIYEMQEKVRNGLEVDMFTVVRKLRGIETTVERDESEILGSHADRGVAQREAAGLEGEPRLDAEGAGERRFSNRLAEATAMRPAGERRPSPINARSTEPEPTPRGGGNGLISAFRSRL